jgi:hypothetical protein
MCGNIVAAAASITYCCNNSPVFFFTPSAFLLANVQLFLWDYLLDYLFLLYQHFLLKDSAYCDLEIVSCVCLVDFQWFSVVKCSIFMWDYLLL